MDILPDSRARVTKRGFRGKWGLWWVPLDCANCGANCGHVPEETTTFAFYLCNKCYEKWGTVAGTMVEPDAAFWQRVQGEMDEKYGRPLTLQELQAVLDADASPLATLLKEAPHLKGA